MLTLFEKKSGRAFWSVGIIRKSGIVEKLGQFFHNVFTNAGRDFAHNQIYTNTSAGTRGAGFIAVSAEATAPVAGDTTLAGEIAAGGLERADATTKTHTNGTNTTTLQHTFTASASHTAVGKCADFNAASAGTMVHAGQFTEGTATLASGDSLQVTITITLG